MTRVQPDSEVLASPTQQAAASIMPLWGADDAVSNSQALYLSYRFTGFSPREACLMSHTHSKTVHRWREESAQFKELEARSTGPERGELRKEILHLLFIRNYHLALRKDYELLQKALIPSQDENGKTQFLTQAELNYLSRARAHYSPQQLEAIEALIAPGTGRQFNITDFIMSLMDKAGEREAEVSVRVSAKREAAVQGVYKGRKAAPRWREDTADTYKDRAELQAAVARALPLPHEYEED